MLSLRSKMAFFMGTKVARRAGFQQVPLRATVYTQVSGTRSHRLRSMVCKYFHRLKSMATLKIPRVYAYL